MSCVANILLFLFEPGCLLKYVITVWAMRKLCQTTNKHQTHHYIYAKSPGWIFEGGLGAQFCRHNLVGPNLVSDKKIGPDKKQQLQKGCLWNLRAGRSILKDGTSCVSVFWRPHMSPRSTPDKHFVGSEWSSSLNSKFKRIGILRQAIYVRPYQKATPWETLDKMVLSPPKLFVGGSSSCITQRTLLFPFAKPICL